uniref:Tensin-2-like n=1 Tax=Mastacembelus armatus TaxID=205130 RepID=A0A3Q3MCI5_9TELE
MKKHGLGTDKGGIPLKTEPEVHPEILHLAELTKAGSHTFTEKSFKRKRVCDVCKQNIDSPGAFCRECKVAVHKTCEAKVTPTCTSTSNVHGSIKSTQKKRGSIPRSKSVEQVMEHVMEQSYDFDLTYITERIISVFFLPDLEEQQYRRHLQEVASMLKSKHQDKFLLLNLSEKRHDITRLNPKVQDYGWPDLHAPPLDRICAICKAMETWLTSDPSNVVVLHCKGNKGKTGVIVAAFMHYSKISAGADQALTTLAMRKFCEDKVSSSLQPSQNRYIYYFGGLLSGTIKMNSSPLFLHQILIPSLPNFQAGGGYYPFLKIYQSLQLIYTSGLLWANSFPSLCIFGRCCLYRQGLREVVFRVQFHTCTVHGAQLWFGKTELDLACTDDRFPPDATVEFIFSNGPEKIKGREYRKNDATIKVDYNTSDPVVRWDSYENFNLHHQDSMENISHTRGPLDGSLYAQVRKRRGPGSTASAASPNGCLTSSPTVKLQTRSQHQVFLYTSNSTEEDSARAKTRGKEKDRETAILDDADLSSPRDLRCNHSCCNRAGAKCADVGWEREKEPCLSNGHCLGHCSSNKKHTKSQTLPALPSKSLSPPPHSTHMDLCHRHSAHPLPDPYRELFFSTPAPSSGCPCRECSSRHEFQSASVRALHPDQSENPHWSQGAGVQRTREAPPLWENECQWEAAREAEFWQCKSAMPAFRVCHTSVDQGPNRDQPRFALSPHQSYPSPQSLMEPRDGASSGYHTPPLLRNSCSCSPYQSSPAESHESRGYASGYQSGSASPLPTSSPSNVKVGAAKSTGRAPGSHASNYATVFITPVQVKLNGSSLPSETPSDGSRSESIKPSTSLSSSPSTTSPNSPIGSPELQSSPQRSSLAPDMAGHRLTPDKDISIDNKPPSPVPDGYHTPTFPLASYYYPLLNPPLPEKKRLSSTPGTLNGHNSLFRVSSAPSPMHHVTFSPAVGEQRQGSAQSRCREEADIRVNAKFVQDSSKYWYKPGISRDQAIAVLRDKEPGTFLIRDSNSFQGAYGLALKVATPPPNANITGRDPLEQLVRHFLIETGPRGVKIKGCQNESYFGSLSALVYQHSITPISLPCALRVPEKDLVGELQEMQRATNTSTAADLLKQGAACNVLYLNSVETESLTGPEAVSKATKCTLALSPRPVATVVHFKVSTQGITLTDSKRRLFFRRHYPISSVTFSSLDPQDRRWTNSDSTSSKMFGFVARRTGSTTENVCHLFAELDPEQPAVAIVNFINKVMLGPQLCR